MARMVYDQMENSGISCLFVIPILDFDLSFWLNCINDFFLCVDDD